MLGRLKVFGYVAVGTRIATTDMPAGETLPQVDPGIAGLEIFLAALGRGLHVAYLVEMAAQWSPSVVGYSNLQNN